MPLSDHRCQYRYPRETVALYFLCGYNISDSWRRYSNTLLVSLNNRVSFREVLSPSEVTYRSRIVTVPSSNDASSTVHLELEKVSASV